MLNENQFLFSGSQITNFQMITDQRNILYLIQEKLQQFNSSQFIMCSNIFRTKTCWFLAVNANFDREHGYNVSYVSPPEPLPVLHFSIYYSLSLSLYLSP